MDSLKFFKGYGKVVVVEEDQNQTSHQHHHNPTRKPLVAVAISSVILLTLIVAAVIGALIHESVTEPPEPSPSSLSKNPTESIKTVCSVTQYPESCFASISSLNSNGLSKFDPEIIFNLSLKVAIEELKNLTSLPKTLISRSNDPGSEPALKDCASLFEDALSQLNESLKAMDVGAGERLLTEARIGDLKTWISAAMTDQETCLDGLEEMGSTVLEEVRGRVQRSKEYMSNSLAILANINTVLEKFDLSLH